MQVCQGAVTRRLEPHPASSGRGIAILHLLLSGAEHTVREPHDPVGGGIEPGESLIVLTAGNDRPNA